MRAQQGTGKKGIFATQQSGRWQFNSALFLDFIAFGALDVSPICNWFDEKSRLIRTYTLGLIPNTLCVPKIFFSREELYGDIDIYWQNTIFSSDQQ